jgi:hypothetical protein
MFSLLSLKRKAWLEILYADRSSKDEQLLIRLPLVGEKNEREGLSKVKINILFCWDNS